MDAGDTAAFDLLMQKTHELDFDSSPAASRWKRFLIRSMMHLLDGGNGENEIMSHVQSGDR